MRSNGAVECWGYSVPGSPVQPPAGRWIEVSAGHSHACARSSAGAVACWTIFDGAADVPSPLGGAAPSQPANQPPTTESDQPTAGAEQPTAGGQDEPAAAVDASRGRIMARRTSDGRTEFAWLPAGADVDDPVLPSSRYFPVDPGHGRWLRSTPIEVDGTIVGRINARLVANGRIEFGFTPTGGDLILPSGRYFPANPGHNRWLRSTEINLDGS